MLVYGDAKRREATRAKAEGIRTALSRLGTLPRRIDRHARVAACLMEAGELEQGLLDHQLAQLGQERPTELSAAAARVTRAVAELLLPSFRAFGALPLGAAAQAAVAPVGEALDTLLALDLPETIVVSVPEGYAYYGLYPETYLRAADRDWNGGPVRVVGIRSIGTSLAAAVAAAIGPRAETASVRPQGHPFSRQVVLSERLGRWLLEEGGEGTQVAVVDEGPGFSGSSFGSVADWLEDRGAPPDSICFFPSHTGGLGGYANERHRQRWGKARRYVVDFETLFASPGCRWPLESWVEEITGPAEAPIEDLGAGRWRSELFPAGSRWPAAHLQQERRKYRLQASGRRWLLKFAGLGRYGEEKLALARRLQSVGLIPPVEALCHGFLVGPWIEGARPLPLAPEVDRLTVLEHLARYLSFRTELPAGPARRGATVDRLFEMSRFNTERSLGHDVAEAFDEWRPRLPELRKLERPILTDNRMHLWEWLVTPGGRILKADALDHHAGNDLIGAQDLAWDLAGATIELDLDEKEQSLLREAVARRGRTWTAPLQLAFYTLAYLAFQVGHHTLAAEALEGMDRAESARMRRAAEIYKARLRKALEGAAVPASL